MVNLPPPLRRLLPYAALAAVVGVAFHNGVTGDFVLDDVLLVELQPCARKPLLALKGLLLSGSGDCTYRPLRYLSYAADYALWGTNPVGYHLTNLALHALMAGLVFALLRELLAAGVPADKHAQRAIRFAAAFGAALFAVHPAQVDSVTYISGRRDILHAVLFLGALHCFLRYRRTLQRRWAAPIVPLYYLALQSKEMAITLPVITLLVDAALEAASPRTAQLGATTVCASRWRLPDAACDAWDSICEWRSSLRRHPWLIGTLFAVGAAFFAYRGILAPVTYQPEPWGGSRWANTATALGTVPGYARLILWPESLLVDYSPAAYPIHESMAAPLPMIGLAIMLALAGLTLFALRSAPRLALAAGWTWVSLMPVMHIVPHHELMAEHYLYLPLVGVALAVAQGLAWLHARSLVVASALAPAIVLPLTVRTLVRNDDWATEWTIHEAELRVTDDCIRAHSNYAKLLWAHPERDTPRRQRLERHLKRALQLQRSARPGGPQVPRAPLIALLGALRVADGQLDRGLALLRASYAEARALEQDFRQYEQVADTFIVTLLNLGSTGPHATERSYLEEAIGAATEWLPRASAPARPHLLRGRALHALCRLDEARHDYREVRRGTANEGALQAAELTVESYIEQGALAAARAAESDLRTAGFRSAQLDALRTALDSPGRPPPPRCPNPANPR